MRRLMILAMAGVTCYAQRTIQTIAGREVRFDGEGKPGTESIIGIPRGIALDGKGNLFFTDEGFSLVLKLDAAGKLSVIANQVASPRGIAVDADGNVYVASAAGRIRKITPDGSDSTIAGAGTNTSDEGIPAVETRLNNLGGLAIDRDGNLYVAETGAHRVRRIGRDGMIQTVAGDGRAGFIGDGGPATQASLNFPMDVAIDRDGGLLIADRQNGRIRRVDLATGIIRTAAGGGGGSVGRGTATGMRLVGPSGIAAAPDGNFYIFDSFVVTRVSPSGVATALTSQDTRADAGDGDPAINAYVQTSRSSGVIGIATDAGGSIFLADAPRSRVRRIGTNGIITTVAGVSEYRFGGDGGPAVDAAFNGPGALALSSDGTVHVVDRDNCRVRSISPDGAIRTMAGDGLCLSEFDPRDLDRTELATEVGLGGTFSIATGPGDRFYIGDVARIRTVEPDGRILTVVNRGAGFGFSDATGSAREALITPPVHGMYVDREGNLYFSEINTHRVRKVTPEGVISTFAGSGPSSGPGVYAGDDGPATQARLNQPASITGDAAGNIYILDSGNRRIRKVGKDGVITTVAGSDQIIMSQGPFGFPGLAVGMDGSLIISDMRNHRIVRLNADGTLTVVAGGGSAGFDGDGGDAEKALLNNPTGIVFDRDGNLIVADSGNHRIRKIGSAVLP